MNSGIYALVNKQNGKRYVGRTVNLNKRKTTHFWMLENNKHPNKHLQRAWNDGQEFYFEVVEKCEPNRCNDREIYWISFFGSMNMANGYNLCEGGLSTTGYHFTDEGKKKISAANSGRKCSPEVIAKRSKSLKKHMEDDPEFAWKVRNQCRKLNRGGWNKGISPSAETRKRLSEKLKGRHVSEEHKEKLRNLYSGERSLSAKIKASDVVKIRYRFLCGERQIDIAKDYPVTPQTINDICRGRRWKSVPNTLKELEVLYERQTNQKPSV